jgi:prophage regulatory protein
MSRLMQSNPRHTQRSELADRLPTVRACRLSSDDWLERLAQDPGTQTLGQLLQERQWALQEIVSLRAQLARPARHQDGPAPPPRVDTLQEQQRQADALKNPNRLVRMKELRQMIGLGPSTIYKMMQEGRFPRSVHLGERTTAWRLADILAWQETLR